MKKLFSVFMAALLCVSLAACSQTEGDSGEAPQGGEPAASANRDYFEWSPSDKTKIVGYSESGLKQKRIVIPAECTKVGVLSRNDTVEYIEFENPDTEISPTAFGMCSNLKEVKLPANLKTIGDGMFAYCSSLTSVTIPDTVTEIGHDAFSHCTSLETITLSPGLTSIEESTFWHCTSLKSVTIPDSVTSIGYGAFEECTALADVTFGSGIKEIGEKAFQLCESLKSVRLQEGVTTLGKDAFGACAALEEVYLPASIESAEISCLANAQRLTVHLVQGSYMDGRLGELMGGEDAFIRQYQ